MAKIKKTADAPKTTGAELAVRPKQDVAAVQQSRYDADVRVGVNLEVTNDMLVASIQHNIVKGLKPDLAAARAKVSEAHDRLAEKAKEIVDAYAAVAIPVAPMLVALQKTLNDAGVVAALTAAKREVTVTDTSSTFLVTSILAADNRPGKYGSNSNYDKPYIAIDATVVATQAVPAALIAMRAEYKLLAAEHDHWNTIANEVVVRIAAVLANKAAVMADVVVTSLSQSAAGLLLQAAINERVSRGIAEARHTAFSDDSK